MCVPLIIKDAGDLFGISVSDAAATPFHFSEMITWRARGSLPEKNQCIYLQNFLRPLIYAWRIS